jgi:hypothetical protein
MNTVASFIRPFIRLFSFVFVQRTTRRNFTVVGKKQKGYRRQKESSIKIKGDWGSSNFYVEQFDGNRGLKKGFLTSFFVLGRILRHFCKVPTSFMDGPKGGAHVHNSCENHIFSEELMNFVYKVSRLQLRMILQERLVGFKKF